MSEIFGVAGAAMAYDTMRYTVGYQAVRGINIFNPFNFPLGRKGQLLAQELPVFTENQPYCRFLGQFNRYTERLSYLSSLGERVCETGLYYPVSDFQGKLKAETVAKEFDYLGRALEDMTVDFDTVDDDVIESSEGAGNGCICIGNAKYRNIIIPEGAFIPPQTQTVLDRFVKGGGQVSYTLSELKAVIKADGKGLRAMHRKAENAELFFLFREYGENGFENINHSEKALPVNLGDWASIIGSDYSGSDVYEKSFTLPAEKIGKEGEINLGNVRYAAEVYLNGHTLGTALTPPFRLKIPKNILAENNNLKIVVTNTSANWYVRTDYNE